MFGNSFRNKAGSYLEVINGFVTDGMWMSFIAAHVLRGKSSFDLELANQSAEYNTICHSLGERDHLE